jgi:hypothetical protein
VPGYGALGYSFYPGLYVDLPLETYWIRQRQDFGQEPIHSSWGPTGWYDAGAYATGGGWDDEPPARFRREAWADERAERAYPARPAPRGRSNAKESIVDGVPTLVSED